MTIADETSRWRFVAPILVCRRFLRACNTTLLRSRACKPTVLYLFYRDAVLCASTAMTAD